MKKQLSAKLFVNRRLSIAVTLFLLGLMVSSGLGQITPAHAARSVAIVAGSIAAHSVDTSQSTGTTTMTLTLQNYIAPAGTDRLLVVASSPSQNGSGFLSASYGADAMSLAVTHNDGVAGVDIWTFLLGSNSSNEPAKDITLTHPGGSFQSPEFVGAIVFENVDQTAPVSATGFDNSTSDNAPSGSTLTLASAAEDMLFSFYSAFNGTGGAPNPIPGTDQTQQHDESENAAGAQFAGDVTWVTSTKPGAAGNVSVNWDDAHDFWIHIAINIKAVPVDPEPTNHPTSFTATADSHTKITTTWTDSTGGDLPSGYLVMCSTTNSFADPTDGTTEADDTNCQDGSGVQNLAHGSGGSLMWTGLDPNTTYYFKIFPYSNTGVDIDYKTNDTPPTDNATTLETPGTITIIKNTEPDADQDFAFTTTNLTPSSFTLDDDGGSDATYTNSRTFSDVPVANGYVIEETAHADYTTTVNCIGATNSTVMISGAEVTIDLAADEDITCTDLNTRKQGTITFVKSVSGGSSSPSDWTFDITGGQQDIAHNGQATLDTGSYTVTEDGPAGYSLTGASGACSYDAQSGEITLTVTDAGGTCTVTNTRDQGTITFVKSVANGQALPTEFSFDITGSTQDIVHGGQATVDTGSYTVTEDGPTGYMATGASGACSYDSQSGEITLNVTTSGGTCTITNTASGTITFNKVVSGGSASAPDWTFDVASGPQDIAHGSSEELVVGSYTVTEDGPGGYTVTDATGACSLDVFLGTISLEVTTAGGTCTITNTRDQGEITFEKVVSGGSASPSDFSFDITGGPQDTPHGSSVDVDTGTYTVTEDGPAGYTVTDASGECSYDPQTGDVTLDVDGDGGTCTITNTRDQGTITFVKVVSGGSASPTDFTFDVVSGPQDIAHNGSETLDTDSYTVTEDGPAGYVATNASGACSLNSGVITLDVTTSGGTCTITNELAALDLAVDVSESTDPVVAGSNGGNDNLVHTITVTNNGPADATNIVIQFTSIADLTPTLDFQSGSHGPGGNEWTIPSLASGESATMTHTWDVGSGHNGSNSVIVSAMLQSLDQTDTNSGNDDDSEQTTIVYDVDLSLDKSDNGADPQPGNVLVYELTATNNGVSDALDVVFTETVPANTTFNAAGSTAGWSCSDGDPAGTVCTLNFGSIAANGGVESVDFAVLVDNGTSGTTLTNEASVVDNNTGSNDDAEETTPVGFLPASCDPNDAGANYTLIMGTDRRDRITGTPGNDIIIVKGDHDTVDAKEGNDCIIGGAGNDRIYGGPGDDIIWGGEENNTVVYDRSDRDRLYGREGNDLIYGGGDHDHIEGDEGNDTLYGNDGNDGMHGDDDNDDMFGGPGRDRMDGHDGNDEMHGGPDDDTLIGRDGNDDMFGDGGRDRLNGGDGNDELHGGTEDDRLEGEEGDDDLFGGEGRDSLKGHDGDDYIEGGSEDDDINGGHDNDEIYGDGGNDRIQAERGDDIVYGGMGDDILDGHDGNDQLFGEEGDDELKGGKGDDLLDGGDNFDELDGGHDDDTCLNGEDLRSCELP
ncbi:MAG: hypothetical protein AAF614_27020 [Chloroflexota bacterium]